ncbi:aminopeptidase [Flammeovirga aprica]|uniref:Aminopeptidase n=1 Tax=Flammeovirga aprica JL-4 TaxID=694437 RepID=A0A7X9XA65_9BACT|nr:aminopeptidase [Flammeovirga aprica]NME69341.1 aminopeptidase [Flammeovirga aprica JL-4]
MNKKSIFTWLKRFFLTLLLGVFCFLGYYHEETIYGIRQGLGQMDILVNTQPIEAYLNDTSFTEKQKEKIKLIQEIRQFTIDSLGLDDSGSYKQLYDQKGKPILWIVTGSEPFDLKAKKWTFPIAGAFSYKGFFVKELVEEEKEKLIQEGWDASIGEVSAWSTLGFLNDPILSSMLERNEGSLAHLIIHELTHGTIYLKNSVSYNENLADFVGDEGAKRFLIYKYGKHSSEYVKYMSRKQDRKTFSEYLLQSAKSLDSLYKSFPEEMTVEEKTLLKAQKIKEITEGIQHLSFANSGYCRYFNDFTPNNTFFMGYIRYRGKQNEFKAEFENDFNSDFHAYFSYLKQKEQSLLHIIKKIIN